MFIGKHEYGIQNYLSGQGVDKTGFIFLFADVE